MLLKSLAVLLTFSTSLLATDAAVSVDDELVIRPLAEAIVFDCERPAKHPTIETYPVGDEYARGFLFGTKLAFESYETKEARDVVSTPKADEADADWLTVEPQESNHKFLRYLGGGGTIKVIELPTVLVENLASWGSFPFQARLEMRDYDFDYSGPFYEKHEYVVWSGDPTVYTCRITR